MATPIRPTDNRSKTCTNISSECVVWDGPDIPCLDLCHGDSIEKVVYEAAVNLCNVLDVLSLQGIDTSCLFADSCKPSSFEQLLQYIIDWMCRVNTDINTALDGVFDPSDLNNVTITFTDCNGAQQTLPLTSTTGPNIFTYIIDQICQIRTDITTINNNISVINTEITAIWTAINNLGSTMSFTPFNPNNCIRNTNVTTFSDLITYINDIAGKLCALGTAIGFTDTNYITPSYTYTCSVLGISATNVNNLMGLYNFFNTFFGALCSFLDNINTSITNIQNNITTINNTLSLCQCDCSKEVYVVSSYDPKYDTATNKYVYDNISFSVIFPGSYTLTSINIFNNNLKIIDNNDVKYSNTSPLTFTTSSFSIDLSSLGTGINISGCATSQKVVNNKLTPDKDIKVHVYLKVELDNAGNRCEYFLKTEVPLKHCICGYVENIDFIEGPMHTNVSRT